MRDQNEKIRHIQDLLNQGSTPKGTPRSFRLDKGDELCPQTPLSQVNTQGTLYRAPNLTPSLGQLSKKV